MKNTDDKLIFRFSGRMNEAILAFIFCLSSTFCFAPNGFSQTNSANDSFILDDSHFHLTNYAQERTDIAMAYKRGLIKHTCVSRGWLI